MDDSELTPESSANGPDPELVSWLRKLGPRYGLSQSMLLSQGPGGNIVVLAVLGPAQDPACGGTLDERLERLVGEARSRMAAAALTGACCSFTRAELEVLRWLRLGRTNREIGKILYKSEFTIKTHVQHMLAKTGLDNRLQLASLPLPDRTT